MNTVTIRCAEGRQVPMPDGTEVPRHGAKHGITVLLDMFVQRRLDAGDVEIVEPVTPAKKAS